MTKILIDEALRLADAIQLGWLENVDADKADIDMIQTELRRLHAENQALRQALEQPAPAQEPVAWLFQHEETGLTECVDAQQVEWGFEKNNPRWQKVAPLYTTPPAPAQPLTDEQIDEIDEANWQEDHTVWGIREFARAIEAAHGITKGNT
jgi:hypothetical protein